MDIGASSVSGLVSWKPARGITPLAQRLRAKRACSGRAGDRSTANRIAKDVRGRGRCRQNAASPANRKALLNPRLRRVEPLLQKINAQHPLNRSAGVRCRAWDKTARSASTAPATAPPAPSPPKKLPAASAWRNAQRAPGRTGRSWVGRQSNVVVGDRAIIGSAASASQMGRFETEWLTWPENLAAFTDLPGRWIDKARAATAEDHRARHGFKREPDLLRAGRRRLQRVFWLHLLSSAVRIQSIR